MSSPNKGLGKVEIGLRWDPSPYGEPDHDLDLIAATFSPEDPHGSPVYLVHFDSRSPDGVITLNRDSTTGQGLGDDEVMTLEFDRMDSRYARVVVGVVVQQRDGHKTFGDVPGKGVRIREGHTELTHDDLSRVSGFTAATVAEFVPDGHGAWELRETLHGFDDDPETFTRTMGTIPS